MDRPPPNRIVVGQQGPQDPESGKHGRTHGTLSSALVCVGPPPVHRTPSLVPPSLVVRLMAVHGTLDACAHLVVDGTPCFAMLRGAVEDEVVAAYAKHRAFTDHSVGSLIFPVKSSRADVWQHQMHRIARVVNLVRPEGAIPVDAEQLGRQASGMLGARRVSLSVVIAHCDGPWLRQTIAMQASA